MKKIMLISLLTISVVAFLIGFIEISKEEEVENKSTITYSISSFYNNLKEVGSLDIRIQDIICATSKGLVELDSSNNIIPALAEGVEIRDDGLEYDFKLKSDIYWSDGTAITPKDVMAFFREIITEEAEDNIEAVLNVYGAKKFREGYGDFSQDVGISIGEDNIVFRLNSKDDKFIEELTKPQYRVRKNVLLWENIKNSYDDLIYSGNYIIADISEDKLILKRNEKADKSLSESITIILNEEEEIAMASFEVGDRDLVINPPKSQLERLNNENKLITTDSNNGLYIIFNNNSDSLTIEDKKIIYSKLNNAMEKYQLENTKFMELAEGSYFRQDKDDLLKMQSRKVMLNSSNEELKVKSLVIVAEALTENKEICEYISNYFSENTEIDVSYKLLTEEEMNSIKNSNYYNIALIKGDITGMGNTEDYNKIVNLIPDEYGEKLIIAKNEGERREIFKSIEEELYNNYKILPLAFYNNNIAVNSKIKNIIFDGHGNIDYYKIGKS
ncbi:ABC transporter substrate-binding protein [Clostridium isatidis]|uniref:Solute-binding protein family 5 domain-containing protein n=1 Tax=Clostridium isatidis TaxID=182773 RepID=A0A343JF13_9CLOT|nr:ABC transporter substrate-binding protein [Clostridium isatidis]ASW44121.1 hypothetical protein BEN51_11830 [Clostridium isatidis]